jgi:hypothetical protein
MSEKIGFMVLVRTRRELYLATVRTTNCASYFTLCSIGAVR